MSRRKRDNPRLYYADQMLRKMNEMLKEVMWASEPGGFLHGLPPMTEDWELKVAYGPDGAIIPELEFIDDNDRRFERACLVNDIEKVRKSLDELADYVRTLEG